MWLNIDSAVAYTALPSSPYDEDGNYLGERWVDPDYEEKKAATKAEMLAATLSGSVAAAAAVAWAREAGLKPVEAAEVESALTVTGTFVEDQLFTLLNRLGIDDKSAPTSQGPHPASS
jgi:hypothetical protein